MEKDNEQEKDTESEIDTERVAEAAGGEPGGQEEEALLKLQAAEHQAAENLAGWQRAKADFLNYKKDQERMRADLRRYAHEDIILALLPTVDSFELATKHLPEELKESDWVKGILCIKGMFESFLREAGVSEIESLGQKFDPQLFEAVGETESDAPADTVVEEVQKGYRMGDKVIRPAKVKIVKG